MKMLFAPSIVFVVLLASTRAALAQAGAGSAPAGAAPAAPAPAAAAPPPATSPPAASPPAMSAPADLDTARAACRAALNGDPKFAAEIVRVADEKAQLQRDLDTVEAHNDAYRHVQKNERHVIYAYAAMWIVAAGFVIFLWRRQQVLSQEIAQLHRDLEAAGADARSPERS